MLETWRGEKLNHWFTSEWIASLGAARAAFDPAGAADGFHVEAAEPQAAKWRDWVRPTWLQLRTDPASGAALIVGCPFGALSALAAPSVGSTHDEAALLEVFREMLTRTAAGAGAAAPSHGLKQLSFAPAEAAPEAPKPDQAVELRFEIAGKRHTIVIAPNRGLLRAMFLEETAAVVPGSTAGQDPEEAQLGLSPEARQNLQMLLDVELELSVSFGQTRLPLEDVLKLSSGSIVELNRSISEPVSVLVNDCVVARGEVVVVDGNYGVRITEIATRQERIRSIL